MVVGEGTVKYNLPEGFHLLPSLSTLIRVI